jgi:FG-GAP repeat
VVPTKRLDALLVATALGSTGLISGVASWSGNVSHQMTPPIGQQLAELAPRGAPAYDWFGNSVAVSGNTIVVGAPAVAGASSGFGRAYVFAKTVTGWHETGELAGSGGMAHDWFGDAVAISGNTIVVGAPSISVLTPGLGRAYVFTRTATGWHGSGELAGYGTTPGDLFGVSVAISGRTIVVGAPSHASKAGAAYVFIDSGGHWQGHELKGYDTVSKDDFGDSVAISGGTIVVGAFDHASEAGRAYVFTKGATGWHQVDELVGADTVAGDGFGVSVAISGETVAVGSGLAASDAGRGYLFTKGTTGWHQAAELVGPGTIAGDDFGDSVAVSGSAVVVGTFAHTAGAAGAYLFIKTPTGWSQSTDLAGSDTSSDDEFGYSVAVSGTTIAVGAYGHDSGVGRVYVFEG